MPRLVKTLRIIILVGIFIIAAGFTTLASGACGSYSASPPFLSGTVTPALLLMIDNSASMYDLAYVSANDTYCFDDSFDTNGNYAGYFNENTFYEYNFADGEFQADPTATAITDICSAGGVNRYYSDDLCIVFSNVNHDDVSTFGARGNFLNWLAASKFDVQKMVLTGGKYDAANNRFVMESRGCLDRKFAKKVLVQDNSGVDKYATLGIRGSNSTHLTLIDIYDVTDNGFDNSACQSAIEELAKESPSQGQLKQYIDDCLTYPKGNNLLADSHAAFNHAVQECWYYAKHGEWQPGGGTVNSMKNACEKVYGDGVSPSAIIPSDRGYVCYGVYDQALNATSRDGYVGRCWEPEQAGADNCTQVSCDNSCTASCDYCPGSVCDYEDGGTWYRCGGDELLYRCTGNYKSKKNECVGGGWEAVYRDAGGADCDPGALIPAQWTDDFAGDPDACVEQAIKDFCGIMEIPEVPDPSDLEGTTGEFWNIPAMLVDSGVEAQLGRSIATLNGYIAQYTAPEGILQAHGDRIRMGAMIFNDYGSETECNTTDPHIQYYCEYPGDEDGARIISDIKDGNITQLVSAINDIQATTWTPLAEAYYEAIGYYTANSGMRLNADDFNATYDPVEAWCQSNNILLITEGGSSADMNAQMSTFAAATGDGDVDTADCGLLDGCTYFDDLVYYAKHGENIFNQPAAEYAETPYENITTFVVSTGSGRIKGTGECNATKLLQGAAENGDDNGTLYHGNNATALYQALEEIFGKVEARTASGTVAPAISASRGGEGLLSQAIFWPRKLDGKGNEVLWSGDVHTLLIDAYARIYEDSNGNKQLDDSDERIRFYYDDTYKESRVCFGTVEGGACSGTSKSLDQIKYLWSVSDWLSEINDIDILSNRSTHISEDKQRYIFTWEDLDNDGIVDDGEVLDFEENSDWSALAVAATRGPVPLDFGVETSDEVNAIIDWVRGDRNQAGMRSRQLYVDTDKDGAEDTEVTMRLGDVVYSTPMSVGAPAENYDLLYKDLSYREFVRKYRSRRQVIYFGGNDGMLHAVNAGFFDPVEKKFCKGIDGDGGCVNSGPELGAELWAYVPYNVLPHLKCLTDPDYTHQYFVDLRPRIFDVRIFSEDDDHPGGWGTILVGGMRFGGGKVRPGELDLDENGTADYPYDNREFTSAYFILDITNPEDKPVLLGETTRTVSGSEVDLGYTTAIPTMVPMKDGDTSSWYLILGSGPTALDGSSDQDGRLCVLPLDWLKDQTHERSLRIPDATPTALAGEGGCFALTDYSTHTSFISDPITVDFDLQPDYKADVVYFGTVWKPASGWGGRLQRLKIRKTDANGLQVMSAPHEWSINLMMYALEPVVSAPSVGWDGRNYWVYFGTGRFFDAADKSYTAMQYYYGVKEPVDCDGAMTWAQVSRDDLLRVDQIRVKAASTASQADLTCKGGGDACLPENVDTLKELLDYIVGTGCSSPGTAGWRRELTDSGERNLAQATLFGGLLTFTTYTPNDDICNSEGSSDLYGLHYQTGTAWSPSVFGDDYVDEQGNVEDRIDLGEGLATSPSIHVGRSRGAKAFIQTSTGEILEIYQPNLPYSAHSGEVSWHEISE